jgi:hypothetical protein
MSRKPAKLHAGDAARRRAEENEHHRLTARWAFERVRAFADVLSSDLGSLPTQRAADVLKIPGHVEESMAIGRSAVAAMMSAAGLEATSPSPAGMTVQ